MRELQAGLSAGSLAIDHHRLESFRRTIHCCRQAARAAADNSKVVKLRFRAGPQANLLGKLGRGRLKHARTIGKQRQR